MCRGKIVQALERPLLKTKERPIRQATHDAHLSFQSFIPHDGRAGACLSFFKASHASACCLSARGPARSQGLDPARRGTATAFCAQRTSTKEDSRKKSNALALGMRRFWLTRSPARACARVCVHVYVCVCVCVCARVQVAWSQARTRALFCVCVHRQHGGRQECRHRHEPFPG